MNQEDEDRMVHALYRAKMIEKYNDDPGPYKGGDPADGDDPGLFGYILIAVFGFMMLKTWLSS